MSVLHLSKPPTTAHCDQIIEDSQTAIRMLPDNMKAYYQLAQAQIALHQESEALASAQTAHALCVTECRKVPMGKGSSSIGNITELVLKCKREWWEARETRRLRERGGLVEELVEDLQRNKQAAISQETSESQVPDIIREYDGKIEELRTMFEQSQGANDEGRRRKVPDWCIDDISFSVMLDPVVVSPSLDSPTN
jgi:STIP1 family protein 1